MSLSDVGAYLAERISVDTKSGCWCWANSCGSHGYGNAFWAGKFILAHRLSYLHHKGEIPHAYEVHHKCFNTKCINPEHLEAITPLENKQIKLKKKQLTPCSNGHGMDHRYRDGNGKAVCRVCKKQAQAKYRHKIKQSVRIYQEG